MILVLLALAAGGGVMEASAQAPATGGPTALELHADAQQIGYVRLRVRAPVGSTVTVSERVGTGLQHVATLHMLFSASGRHRALTWRCDRLVRALVASAILPDGSTAQTSAEVTTPDCGHRLALSVRPAGPRAGRLITVRVRDRWSIGGLALQLCTNAPNAEAVCHAESLAPGRALVSSAFRPQRAGHWTVAVRNAFGEPLQRVIGVLPVSHRVTVLATGDSMIQLVDNYLESRVGGPEGVRVSSDARVGSGISKLKQFDWLRHARGQARRLRPAATVIFLGANDGFTMKSPAGATFLCCGAGWIAEYARRAALMMRSYLRDGRGRVYWVLLPTPRPAAFQGVFRAVNAALRRAAPQFGDGVRLLDLSSRFTPGGRYRAAITVNHHRVVVRQDDGIHLSLQGASIAAELIVRALRSDRIVP